MVWSHGRDGLKGNVSDVNWLAVFITLADFDFRWGGGREQN